MIILRHITVIFIVLKWRPGAIIILKNQLFFINDGVFHWIFLGRLVSYDSKYDLINLFITHD